MLGFKMRDLSAGAMRARGVLCVQLVEYKHLQDWRGRHGSMHTEPSLCPLSLQMAHGEQHRAVQWGGGE